MRIREITLTNIGPYVGENTLVFHTDDVSKNIILIGGRNGAGKTTLFEAMKICLYGYKLYGYRQNSQTYTSKIKAMINDSAKKSLTTKAGVSLSVLIEDGYSSNIFTISRDWAYQGNQIKETCSVCKDGTLLGDEEQMDFDNYILQTIPPALFHFHFFNGEDITALLFDKESGQSFRKAFMQICGLDTLDLIVEQLQSSIRLKEKDDALSIQEEYYEKRTQFDQTEQALLKITTQLNEAESEIAKLEEGLALLESESIRYGRMQSTDWRQIQEQIRAEENQREEAHRSLKEIANNILPFLILKNELIELRQQLQNEASIAGNRTLQEHLQKEQTKTLLSSKLAPYLRTSSQMLEDELLQILYDTIKNDYPESATEFLKLSERERLGVLSKIEECLMFDKAQIIETEKRIKNSVEKTKRLRVKADSKEVLNSEIYLSKKNALLTQIDLLRKQIINLTTEKAKTAEEFSSLAQAFEKASMKYKQVLKARSVGDISARTFLAFDELRKSLYKKYISLVEEAFIRSFNSLLSKDRLLDGISISEEFEVVPYKYEKVNVMDIQALIDEDGERHVKERLGERAFSVFKTNKALNGFIELPVKIEQHFSAGERQIYVMALYQALAEIRLSEIPFVIDTPLARIDSIHRKNILKEFFPNLPGQVIILSTDEEIDTSNIEVIQPRLANLYLIEHHEDAGAVILKNRYFEEAST